MARRLALFISAHGYGHAARAAALIEQLWRQRPETEFHVWSAAPEWLVRRSTSASLVWHRRDVDVGLVQHDALEIDWQATLDRLEDLLRGWESQVASLADELRGLGCAGVVCDIAPLGLAAGRRAGLPSILVENFTWDWIYQDYLADRPGFRAPAERLAEEFAAASLHVQTEPVCRRRDGAVRVPPIARRHRRPAEQVRDRLGVASADPLVLLSMGGLGWSYEGIEAVAEAPARFVMAAEPPVALRLPPNVIRLALAGDVYHPDLVAASDLVVGKLGASTVGEAYRADTAYAYVQRDGFRESRVLARFVETHLPACALARVDFASGAWVEQVGPLLIRREQRRERPGGAAEAAREIVGHLGW